MRHFEIARSLGLLVLSLASTSTALAQRGHPGSLLVFPEFDSRLGIATVLTVTNMNPNESVLARWTYVQNEVCDLFDRDDFLSPNDTLTVVARIHYPHSARGFVSVHARSPESEEAITFNDLIGMGTVIDGIRGTAYSVEPFSFRGRTGHGNPTDLDLDADRDLDGKEYQPAPDVIVFPRFVGQEPDFLPNFESHLVLLNLTATQTTTAYVEVILFNDNEQLFSAEHSFHCWSKTRLSDVSPIFLNAFLKTTDEDPDEVVGAVGWEAGWFRVDGIEAMSDLGDTYDDPALLGMLVDGAPADSATPPYAISRQGNGEVFGIH